MSSNVDDFNTRNKVLIAKLLRQGYRYHKIRKAFSKLYWLQFDIVSKYNVGGIKIGWNDMGWEWMRLDWVDKDENGMDMERRLDLDGDWNCRLGLGMEN